MKKHEVKQTRRAFLKGALVSGGAAAIVIATGDALTAPAVTAPVQPQSPQAPESKGYHVTDHIQDYYKTARG